MKSQTDIILFASCLDDINESSSDPKGNWPISAKFNITNTSIFVSSGELRKNQDIFWGNGWNMLQKRVNIKLEWFKFLIKKREIKHNGNSCFKIRFQTNKKKTSRLSQLWLSNKILIIEIISE